MKKCSNPRFLFPSWARDMVRFILSLWRKPQGSWQGDQEIPNKMRCVESSATLSCTLILKFQGSVYFVLIFSFVRHLLGHIRWQVFLQVLVCAGCPLGREDWDCKPHRQLSPNFSSVPGVLCRELASPPPLAPIRAGKEVGRDWVTSPHRQQINRVIKMTVDTGIGLCSSCAHSRQWL